MATLLSWLGGAAQRVGNTIHNDVVQPIQRDVIRPVNNIAVQPALQLGSQAESTVAALGAGIGGLGRVGAANLTNNNLARQNALNQTLQAMQSRLANNRALLTNQQAQQGGTSLIRPILSGAGRIAPYAVGGVGSGIVKPALTFGGANAIGAGLQGDFKPRDLAKSFALGAAPVGVGKAISAGVRGAPVAGRALKTYDAAQNQLGAVGKNVNKASNPPDFLKTSPGYKPKTPRQLADLPPKEQMALSQPKTPLRPAAINTSKNPFKSDIPNVNPGDYKQAIANEQYATKPTQFAGERWTAAMKKLSPDETKNFWRSVEKPNANHSPQLKAAVSAWREVANRVHGTSQQLGGNTNYVTDYALHPWQLPEDFANHVVNGGSPDKFPGINSMSRIHQTIAAGEKAGLKLGTDPLAEGQRFIGAASALIRRRAIINSVAQADSHIAQKTQTLDLGSGHSVPISADAAKALKGLQKAHYSTNPVIKGARTANVGLKSSLLSIGQFHPINISALRAGPTLALTGHPVAAVKGVAGTFRPLLPGGSSAVERMKTRALNDGMVDKAAKINMPYGSGGFDTGGSALKGGLGHNMVFNKQMPMMHDQVVRSIVHDLEKKGVSLDSQAARDAGLAGNRMMGFINKEAQNVSPAARKAMGDWLLAGQFTPSKFGQVKAALTPGSYTKGAVAGKYAAGNVVANVAATTALAAGIGYIARQKSDNLKDLLLRALIDPAAPTSSTDAKGNTVKLRTPGTNTSDIAKLLGIKLARGSDGHLSVSLPKNIGDVFSTMADFGRARLSPGASAGVKVATNTTFANKPLYNPNASGSTKAAQIGTSLALGNLPIGLQGVPQLNAVKSHLPGTVQDVLNAQTPGTNPLVKSVGSSFGLTPSTDQTVGKGKQTADYFASKDSFVNGLNTNEKALYNKLNPTKTDGFGNKIFTSNVLTKPSDWADLQANPGFLSKYVVYQRNQPQHDPIWDLSQKQLNDYINLQKIKSALPGSSSQFANTDKAYINSVQGSSWYGALQSARSSFFNNLQSQGVKLNNTSNTTQPSAAVSAILSQLGTPGTNSSILLDNNPEAQKYLATHANELNQQRTDLGLPALPVYPNPPNAAVSQKDAYYNTLPTGTGARSAYLKANPDYQAYWQQKQDYYTALDGSSSSSGYGGYGSGGRKDTGAKARTAFKTAKAKAIKAPTGIKVKAPAAPKFATRTKKLSVSKMTSSATTRKLG